MFLQKQKNRKINKISKKLLSSEWKKGINLCHVLQTRYYGPKEGSRLYDVKVESNSDLMLV